MKELSSYEKEFIQCFQHFYEQRGRSETLGQVFGLLFIRAPSPQKGLSQKEISLLLDKSKSSVSRALDLITDQGFCSYVLVDNEYARAERKYSVKGSFKELSISRTEKELQENLSLKEDLVKIKNRIPKSNAKKNDELLTKIDLFCDLSDVLIKIHKHSLDLLQQHYQNAS